MSDEEVWKHVARVNGFLEVSNLGRVRATRVRRGGAAPGAMLRGCRNKGYLYVSIAMNGTKTKAAVSRLVLEAFVGPCPPEMECAHLNGVRDDNRLVNLAWVTRSENMGHKKIHGTEKLGSRCWFSKLKESDVLEIRRARHMGVPTKLLAEKYGVTAKSIGRLANGRSWAHLKDDSLEVR